MVELRKRKLPNSFEGIENTKRRKTSESNVEKEPSNSQVVKYDTTGDGNCFFHAVFGDNSSDTYKAERAQDMRTEWHKFLSQFESLNDPKMPDALKQHFRGTFEDLLHDTEKVFSVSKELKELVRGVNKKVNDVINENAERTEALKNKIIERFFEDEGFRNEVYEVIKQSINARNERNAHSPKDQRDLLSIENSLKEENKQTLCDRIGEELESCTYILDTTLTKEKYREEYVTNNDIILDSVIGQKIFYQAYLAEIQKQVYFVFHGEILVLASLSNTEIEAYFEGQKGTTIYKPKPSMINPEYVRKDELWGSKERKTIYLGGNHYSRAKTKEIQEQEDFELAKQLQLDEILEYCNISKDISERKEVEERFDELLAKNADGKISDVVEQCARDIKQHIERSEKQKFLSPSCSMEEARVTPHQQQQILAQ